MESLKKILVVDDDSFTRQLVRSMLSDLECEIYEGSNGNEAISMTRAILPDLVIMDVIMPMGDERVESIRDARKSFQNIPEYGVMDVSIPGGNGIEAARIIKAEFPGLPIIGISGAESAAQTSLGAKDYLQILKFLGAEETLVKPVSREHLLGVVSSLLAKRTRFLNTPSAEDEAAINDVTLDAVSTNSVSEHSKPVPDNLERYLNKEQRATISMMQNFGWKLLFVRRSTLHKIIAMMESPTAEHTACIEQDGELNTHHNVFIRGR
jgi:CheY-like chemotaxis protein